MIEHTLHLPRQHRKMEIPFLGDRNKCFFCGSYSATPGTRCRCGVWYPSENSIKRPRPSKTKKTPPRVDRLEYEPQHDPDNWPEIDHEDESIPWD